MSQKTQASRSGDPPGKSSASTSEPAGKSADKTAGPPSAMNSKLREQLLAGSLFLAFAVGGFAMWRHVKAYVLARSDYQLSPDEVEITPTPAWIRIDLREEVLEESGLVREASILDEDLAPRLHAAFAAHPWVERVENVIKRHPSRVEVDLVYRKPVCMVELPQGYSGVYPVDRFGVVLPTKDFTSAYAEQFPRLVGIAALPAGKVGTGWGERAVTEGAAVAAVLFTSWRPLRLQHIRPMPAANPQNEAMLFELVTESGSQVIWGHAPGPAAAGEPSADEKLAQLKQALAGSTAGKGQVIDLRRPGETQPPHTALVPDEEPAKF